MAYIINTNQLLTIMPDVSHEALELFKQYYNRHADQFGITTDMRAAGFLAQIAVESMELRATVENLNYSTNGLLKTFPKYFNAVTAQQYARKPQATANRRTRKGLSPRKKCQSSKACDSKRNLYAQTKCSVKTLSFE